MIEPSYWHGRHVLVTGHTGFKGAWLVLLLQMLGARVSGFSLPPETNPSLFELAELDALVGSTGGDVRDLPALKRAVAEAEPEVILHLAAQSLVRRSFANPVDTYATNVMGTVHLLEAVRTVSSVRAVVVVTSDKCYANPEIDRGCREGDPLGGHDPYSSSKAAAELVATAYRDSYFGSGPLLATARAGNVIGGGDWQAERIVPDTFTALRQGRPVALRYPRSTRPWQHVLDALSGYLVLAQKLGRGEVSSARAWNFGPTGQGEVAVYQLAEMFAQDWSVDPVWVQAAGDHPPEAPYLRLDASEAINLLGWRPSLSLNETIQMTAGWYRDADKGVNARALTERQIEAFLARVGG